MITEITKIQIRRGFENQTGVPQLDTGEMAWAIDSQQLFIGNKFDDGAVETTNTRILTVLDIPSIFSLATVTNYTYQYTNAGPAIQRTIQAKFDDTVSLSDFHNTSTSLITVDLQSAIDRLYLDSTTSSRKILTLPAGEFLTTGTVFVPSYATIVGAGAGNTIIRSSSTASIFQFCSKASGIGVYHTFDGVGGLSSNEVPTNIRIEGITLEYDTMIDQSVADSMILADCSRDSIIKDCEFIGYNNTSSVNFAGINVRGQGEITSRNLKIYDNVFTGLYAGVKSDYDIEDTLVVRNKFYDVNHGVAFAKSLAFGNDHGPRKTNIIGNQFETVYEQAIYVGSNTNNTPTEHFAHNNFYVNVGNGSRLTPTLSTGSDYTQLTEIIYWGTPGNYSSDTFNRLRAVNTTSGVTFLPFIKGASYSDNPVITTASIVTSATPVVFVQLPLSGTEQSIKVRYIVDKSSAGISRSGELSINVALGGTVAAVTDRHAWQGPNDGDITFSASINTLTNIVAVAYTSTNDVGVIQFNYTNFQ